MHSCVSWTKANKFKQSLTNLNKVIKALRVIIISSRLKVKTKLFWDCILVIIVVTDLSRPDLAFPCLSQHALTASTCLNMSKHVPTNPDLSRPFLTCLYLSWPVPTYPDLSRLFLKYPDLFCLAQTCSELSWPLLTSPDLSLPVPTCRNLSWPLLFWRELSVCLLVNLWNSAKKNKWFFLPRV